MIDTIKAWAVGISIAFVMGRYVWPYLKAKVPGWIVGYMGPRLLAALKGGGATDEDISRFITQVTYAVVVLAEAKFPDKGLGKQKFDWAYSYLSTAFPIMEPFLTDYGKDISELVNAAVIQMDEQFREIKALGDNSPAIMMLPTVPVHRLEED